MSYDLNFWKQTPGMTQTPQKIYESLCDGNSVDGLKDLPVRDFFSRIQQIFPKVTEEGGELHCKLGTGGFSVSSSRQHARVDCYGMSGDDMNKFIDIAAELDCPLYDPQTGQRYDDS